MLFLNKDPELAKAARRIVEEELQLETLSIVGWRDVPTNEGVLGEIALSSLPRIEQIFVNAPAGWRPRDMERRLFIARRRIEKRLQEDKDFYVCSLSNLVNIYKGLCMPADLPRFYWTSRTCARSRLSACSTSASPPTPYHAGRWRSRSATAHNGEINTITGNRQWARARTYKFQTPLIPDLHDAAPFVNETGSDSSSMDNMLELLLAGGMDIVRAMRLLVPPARQNNPIWIRSCVRSSTLTPCIWSRGTARRASSCQMAATRPVTSTVTVCARRATSLPKISSSPAPPKSASGITSLTKWSRKAAWARAS